MTKPSELSLGRFAPLFFLLAAMVLFFGLGLDRYFTFSNLRENRHLLLAWVDSSGVVATTVYIFLYAAVVALSVPAGAVMSIAGGFLFGAVWGTIYILIGATTGATGLFVIAKTSLGDFLLEKAGPWMKKMEGGFQENALSYLLILRLVPLFPFFVVNLVPAFLGVRLSTYIVATFFGIIPGTAVFALVGAGLGNILDGGGELSLTGILTRQIIAALIGLPLLAFIPVLYKKIKGA